MGVPKFYRWISERYPCLSTVVKEYQIPEFDNLYLDMNGIIHVCSHPNDDDPHFRITEDKIFLDIFNYIDFLFRMIKPKKTFFMAVDGVAPRAKMNQQRGRRFKSAKEAAALEKQAIEKGETLPTEARFDSNCISPGTEFMARLQAHLKRFVACKVSTDPLWQNVKVYLSGHQTPGEGEHKVMDFIRTERSQPGYDPNTRHCLYGLDADLIMLGICSHEPHFALLREEIVYGKRQSQKRLNVPEEITFHLLHLSLLREYLELEFQAVKEPLPFEFNLESIIDDWVLMCFLVGNDFIPHLPNLHIAHNALPILYKAYIDVLPTLKGYINESGKLNLDRFEKFLERLSQFDYEKFSDVQADQKFLQSKREHAEAPNGIVKKQNGSPPAEKEKARDPDELRLLDKFQHLDIPDYDSDEETEGLLEMEFRQHKRDYYVNKLEYKDVNKEVMQEQAHGYVRAIQWNLHYYYNGVQSWNWYYPHHYSPYISDIRDFQNLDMSFDMGKPFLPFQQLMAILPAASKNLVPSAYQDLMECESSPILDYYPKDFATDLNGKQHDWEAVVLIPFIDENRLLPAMEQNQQKLTEEERARNGHRGHLLFTYSKEEQPALPWHSESTRPLLLWQTNHAKVVEVDAAAFRLPIAKIRKGLLEGSKLDVYFPGFPTFKHLEYTGKMGKEGIKVFQSLTRNESMIITIVNKEERSLKDIAAELLGKCVHVHWPHLLEALVVELSNREERFFLDTSKQVKSSNSISQEALSSKEQEIFELKIDAIRDKSLGRYGVKFDDIDVLVECKTLTGRRYVCSSKGRITFEKQWSEFSVPFALQSIVKNITEHAPDFVECKTIPELFPTGSHCFMVGHPHYGCQGKVVDAEPADKQGRVLVKFVVPVEPNLAGVIRNEQNLHRVHYMSAHQLSQQLGVNAQFVSRITGTVFVQMNSKEAESASLINVGLNLKFNKTCEEIPGYSRKTNESWQYSSKCLEVLQKYVEQYLSFVQRLLPFMTQDKIAVEDLYPKGVGKEEVREVAKWIKEQECSQVPRVKSGAVLLDEGVVQAIEETVDKSKAKLSPQEVILDVHPKHLFRPGLQLGWVAPDDGATYHMFDRVVNVRENFAVPLGYRGTIIGFLPKEENEPQMCEVLFDEPFPGGLPLRCSVDRGYRLSTLFLVNLTYGNRSQRSMQLYQVPARRQQQLDTPGSYPQVMSSRPRVISGQPQQVHAHRGHSWEEESPQRRPGKNRFHHSPNSPFEAQKASPAPEVTSESATSDFASLWLGLQKAATQKPSEVPAPEKVPSSQHLGTPVSLDELFKGAKQLEQTGAKYTPVSSSASILEDLVKRTKEVMGAEPEHFCVGMDGQPPKKFKAFVSLPNGKKFASACMDNQKSALHDAAQQALAFLDEKPPISQAPIRMPLPVPALRPSVPLPFGSAPPPSALPGFARGTRFELRPRCEASLIPDSFVESNRHLMETLNALPPDDCPPQPQQQHRLSGGGGPLSWQMPRMPAPVRHPGGSPRKMQHQQQQQQFPYYHRPNPCNVFVPRPPSLIYQQEQEPYRLQPSADSLLRFPNPAGGRSPQRDGHGWQQQLPAQRQGQQQQPPYPRAHGRHVNHSELHPPRTASFPEHQLSAAANAFVPTQVMRKSSKPGAGANGSKSPMKKESSNGVALKGVAAPSKQTAKPTPKPAAKVEPEPETKPVPKPVLQPSPEADIVLEPKRTSRGPSAASDDGASSEAKSKSRRSRLALKFESTPGAS